jgi:hypothetical protein
MIQAIFYKETLTKEIIIKFLLALLFCLVIAYSSILLSLTGNAISYKKLSLQTKKTTSEITKVERTFAGVLTELNSTNFQSFGFAVVGNSSFAVKKDAIASFSVLYEKR